MSTYTPPRPLRANAGRLRPWPQIYFGVAVTSLATLILELALTRVFSVVYFYHFAFLAISIALFGLGAGGVLSYLVASWRGGLYQKVGFLASANALAIVGSLAFLLGRTGNMSGVELIAAYFVAAVPFVLSGTILSLVIADTLGRVNRVYFFDLVGAASGCAVLIFLLNLLGGPNTILVAAVLFAVSSAIWFHLAASAQGRAAAVLLGLLLVGLITSNAKHPVIDVRFAKGQQLTNEEFVRWNSFSRIALKREPDGAQVIIIDGDANTYVAQLDLQHLTANQRHALADRGPNLPYELRPAAKTLIIGAGGGWDVARALVSGSKDVTGVEINPIIATEIMRKRFADYSNGLYFRPDVHIVVEDGRSFVRRSRDQYGVLQATLVDTWASTAAGAFALSENNLYTTEAFKDYLTHLTPDGVMAFTRWGFDPPRESLRVVALAQTALRQLGEVEPALNIAIVRENVGQLRRWGAQDTVLVARHALTPQDLVTIGKTAARADMQIVYLPGSDIDTPFKQLLTTSHPDQFFDTYAFDVRPVSDNRPFFFYTVQPRDLLDFFLHGARGTADYKINSALPILFGLVAISIVATVIMLSLPPLLLGHRLPRGKGSASALLFFLCVGAGYIIIQVALIQKFVLFLGHPTYALTVIIFSMLLSSGCGSFASKKIVGGEAGKLSKVMWLVIFGNAVLALVVPIVCESGVWLPFAAKVVITVAMISPLGFAMGMPFPTGLTLLERVMPASVRWAWATNAAASVMGSATAMFLSIYLGLQLTLLVGSVFYLGALLSVMRSPLTRGWHPAAERYGSGLEDALRVRSIPAQ